MPPTPSVIADQILELQRGWSTRRDEHAIASLFEQTSGSELTEVKNLIEQHGDGQDLLKLLWEDIDAPPIRERILQHFATQAKGLPRGLKILSDIDDTLYCNWVDPRYPKQTLYPGVIATYRAIDRGARADDRKGDLVFVTARPDDLLGWVERHTLRRMEAMGLRRVSVLCGDITHLLGNNSIADGKHRNFRRYADLFPEHDFVFFGDSGQGDILFGKKMRSSHPERVRAVFIHDVVFTPPSARARLRQEGIDLHDTYVGALARALELGLVATAQATEAAELARRELAEIRFDTVEQQRERMAELERDWALLERCVEAPRMR